MKFPWNPIKPRIPHWWWSPSMSTRSKKNWHLALLVGQGIIGTSVQQTSHHFQMTPLRSNEERCIPPAVATVHLLGRQLRNFAATALRCKVKKRLKWSLVNRLMDYLLYLVDIIWYTIHTIILVNLDIPFINPCSFIYTIHNMIHPWYPYYSYHWASPERDFGWNPQVSFNMKQIPTKSVFYDVLRKRRHRGFNSFKAPGDQ